MCTCLLKWLFYNQETCVYYNATELIRNCITIRALFPGFPLNRFRRAFVLNNLYLNLKVFGILIGIFVGKIYGYMYPLFI